MSVGTLRVLGLLLAAYQVRTPSLMAVEEPEATVHPAVIEVLLEVLLDASCRQQVLLTTHSPDLIDSKELDDTQLRAVRMERGRTVVAGVDEAARRAIRDRLYTPGELLRSGELGADVAAAERAAQQIDLFGPPASAAESAADA
jgi:ABC-type multidrug transport system ATPase subunit